LKHVAHITRNAPAKSADWQEFVCAFTVALNALLSFFGGSSPLALYIEDKCDIPQPNDQAGDT